MSSSPSLQGPGLQSDDSLEVDVTTLPIEDFKEDIIQCVRENQVSVIIGETGSGKTTKIPQYCAEMGLRSASEDQGGGNGRGDDERSQSELWKVAVTQPRRVAAMTVADRVASERGCQLGDQVGYTIR